MRTLVLRCAIVMHAVLPIASAAAADEFEQPPIEYSQSVPDDPVSQLQGRLDRGELTLKHDGEFGYLEALLEYLEVPVESQMLVFSKTSLQLRRISPKTPRAIYFNDDVYVGYCQSGDMIEISAVDPKLGTVFYTLHQEKVEKPRLERQVGRCLICHSSSRTESVPGHLVRSLFVDAGGQPIFSAGSRSVDHTTPFEQRWGGWYVTGKHGAQTHLGNLFFRTKTIKEPVDNTQGENVVKLDDRFDVERYPTPHSDIVALMVLEHQTLVHNRITKANYVARQALHYEASLNKALGEPEGTRLDSTTRRIQRAGDDLVDALLLVGEAELGDPVIGTSGYSEKFPQAGPRDTQGRSLRELDLKRRLFRYPCSYLIYSRAFDALPDPMREYVWQRLWQVLSGEEDSEKFAHLSAEDRQAIREILRDTKTGLPEYWK